MLTKFVMLIQEVYERKAMSWLRFPVVVTGLTALVAFGVACSKVPESAEPAEGDPVTPAEESVSVPADQAPETVEVKPPAPEPSPEPTKPIAITTTPVTGQPEPVEVSEEKEVVALPNKKPVEFPEMKVPEHLAKVTSLFVEANKQFGEKRYVGALQTLRKLDSMELGDRENQALDLFLKRIEQELSKEAEAASPATEAAK